MNGDPTVYGLGDNVKPRTDDNPAGNWCLWGGGPDSDTDADDSDEQAE